MANLEETQSAQELCRMSWFLVEMDDGHVKGGKANGKSAYGVIHAIELLDKDSSNMYINRRVRFNWKHAIIDGYIVMAADDRYFVEQQLIALSKTNEGTVLQENATKKYLVQYAKGSHTMAHAVVHQKEVIWPHEDEQESNIQEVLIRDGKSQRIASVLYVSESDDVMQQELEMLKDKCFKRSFVVPDVADSLYAAPWLLVQHSTGPSNVFYSVINVKDTVWQTENVFGNVVAYFKSDDSILQSVIIRKSTDRTELNNELDLMKKFSLSANYPLSGTSCIKIHSLDQQGSMFAKPVPA